MAQQRKLLGDLLVDAGVITQAQLAEALTYQKQTGGRLGDAIRALGFTTEQQIMDTLEFQMGIPQVDLAKVFIQPEAVQKLPVSLARKYMMAPVKIERNVLYVAMEDPLNFVAKDDARSSSGMEVFPMLASRASIQAAVERVYTGENAQRAIADFERQSASLSDTLREIDTQSSEEVNNAPIVRLVQSLIEQSIRERASDIHIEPQLADVRIRMRVDGRLRVVLKTPKSAHSAIITRIKILAGLNIAEKRVPQDGRFDISSDGHKADIRVSVMPTVHGEKAVLRILDQNSFFIPKEQLGFTEANLAKFNYLLKNPHGIILITGPTGSGKSTTLYTMLSEINNERDNIITIEDPVEYMLPGLNQVQVNPQANLTFAAGLRAILRQDPDVVMIGEIRDGETCEIAMRAAITGHLVLSTLHTNDALSAILRLIDMGAERYLLSGALVGVISQRLVLRLCPHCKQKVLPPPGGLKNMGITEYDGPIYQPAGCPRCYSSGYLGRVAVHEVLVVDRALRDAITSGETLDTMRDRAVKSGLSTLRAECVRLLAEGVTGLSEVLRIIHAQE